MEKFSPDLNSQTISSTGLLAREPKHPHRWLNRQVFRFRKAWILLGFTSVALIALGFSFAGRHGLLICFFAALALNLLVFFYLDLRLVRFFPSVQLEGKDPWGALEDLCELAAKIGLRKRETPRLQLIDVKSPTALSAGLHPRNSVIFVSEELLQRLDREERRAIFAYELQSICSGQTHAATAASAIASLIEKTAESIDDVILFRFLGRSLRKVLNLRTSLMSSMSSWMGSRRSQHPDTPQRTPAAAELEMKSGPSVRTTNDTKSTTTSGSTRANKNSAGSLHNNSKFISGPEGQSSTHAAVRWGPTVFCVTPLVAVFAKIAFSRRLVFVNDRAAAHLIGNPETLARALWKLDSFAKTRPIHVGRSLAHLFTVNPLARPGLARLLTAQPSLEERVRGLTGRFPL